MSSISPDKLVSDFLDRTVKSHCYDLRSTKRRKVEAISTIGDFILGNQINISDLSRETRCRLTLSVFKEISNDPESSKSQKLGQSILLKDTLLKKMIIEDFVFALQNEDFELLDEAIRSQQGENELFIIQLLNKTILGNHEQAIEHLCEFLKRKKLEHLLFTSQGMHAIFLSGNSLAIFKIFQSVKKEAELKFWGRQISQEAFSIVLFSGNDQSIKMFYALCPKEYRESLFELKGAERLSTALSNEISTSFFLEHCPKENLTQFYNACIESDKPPSVDFFEFCCRLANDYHKKFLHPKFEFDPLHAIRTLYKMFPENHKEAFFKPKNGKNPLHFAIDNQRADVIRLLAELSQESRTESIWMEQKLLHYAVLKGDVEVLKAILDVCPESQIEQQWSKDYFLETPFHLAAEKGNVDILRLLLERCPKNQTKNIWSMNSLDHAPFHRATMNGHVEAMLFLLEKVPADELANQWSKDTHECSLLHLAVEGSHGFNLILERYPYPDKESLWGTNTSGETLLHQAVLYKNHIDEVVEQCPLEKDTLWNPDNAGRTPLHLAVYDVKDASVLVRNLLKKASPKKLNEILVQETNVEGTVMYAAVERGYLDVVQTLIEFCPKDKMIPLWKSTPRHSIVNAAIRQNEQFFHAILEWYPKIEENNLWITDWQGKTAVFEALKMGRNKHFLETLLRRCPEHLKEAQWKGKNLLLDIASGYHLNDFNFDDAYDFIVNNCPTNKIIAFFDKKNSTGIPPLYKAIMTKSKEGVKFLLRFTPYDKDRSMWNARGPSGQNLFHFATEDILHLLLEELPEEKINLLSEKSKKFSAPIDLFDDQALEILLNKKKPYLDVLVAGALEGKISKREIFNRCIAKFLAFPKIYSPYFIKSIPIFVFLIENHLSFLVKELVKSQNIQPFTEEELFVLLPALLSPSLRPVIDQLTQANQNAFESLYKEPNTIIKGLDDVEALRIYCKHFTENKNELLKEKDRKGQTFLHEAFDQKKIDVIKVLKELFPNGFNELLFIIDNNGKSPIDFSNKETLGAFLEFSKDSLLDARIVDYSFENSIHSELRSELIAKFISSPELYFEHLFKFSTILNYLMKNEEVSFKAEIEKRGGLNKLSLEQKNLVLPFLKPHEIQIIVVGLTKIEKEQLVLGDKVEEKDLPNIPFLAIGLAAQSKPQLVTPLISYLDSAQLAATIPFLPKEVLFSAIEQAAAPIKKSYIVQRMPLDLKKEIVKTIPLFSELLPQYIEQAKALLEKIINDPKYEVERLLMSLRSKVSAMNIKKMEFDKLKVSFESGEFDEELKQAVQEARNQELEHNKALQGTLAQLDEIAEQQSNAPLAEFIDPHTGKVMENPVILPLSRNRVDRETYFSFTAKTENGERMHFNPYAQKYVLDKDVKDDLELSVKIQDWRNTQSLL